jgi:hypothetical protein
MDEHAKIEAYKDGLRLVYATDIPGLRALVVAMMTEGGTSSAVDSVVITSSSFEGEQSAGAIVLEPMAKLKAATEVLRELDPTAIPSAPDAIVFADFSGSHLQT